MLNDSKKLMRKLKLRINLDEDEDKDMEDLLRCIKNRIFSYCLISTVGENSEDESDESDEYYEYLNKLKRREQSMTSKVDQLVSVSKHLSHVEKVLFYYCDFTKSQFRKLIEVFLPNVKACRLVYVRARRDIIVKYNQKDEVTLACEKLTELGFIGVADAYRQIVFGCDLSNLKRMLIKHPPGFFHDDIILKDRTFWSEADLQQLEYLEISQSCWEDDEPIQLYLQRGTSLKELSIRHGHGPKMDISEVLAQSPSLEHINMASGCQKLVVFNDWCCLPYAEKNENNCNVVYMLESSDHLEKIRFWIESHEPNSENKESALLHWIYEPDDEQDAQSFERKVLDFLNKDSTVVGWKNGDMIKSITLGNDSWLEDNFELSPNFITALIDTLPKLIRIELFSASPVKIINESILATGRKFDEVKISGRNGNLSYGNVRFCEDEPSFTTAMNDLFILLHVIRP
jgi:hypothetical protein